MASWATQACDDGVAGPVAAGPVVTGLVTGPRERAVRRAGVRCCPGWLS